MAAVEQFDLHFFIGRDVIGELHAHRFPGGAAVAELVLQHPLNKRFTHHRPGIVDAQLVVQLQTVGVAGHGRNAVDHCIGEADVGGDPVVQVRVAQCGEGQQGFTGHVAVMRQVIARHHGKGRGVVGAALGEGGTQHAKHRARCVRLGQVLLNLRQLSHKLAGAVVDAVATFGDGQRDDADVRAGQFVDHRLNVVFGQQHVADRADDAALRVVAVAQFEQGIEVVLACQVVTHFAVFGAQADAADAPVQIAPLIH